MLRRLCLVSLVVGIACAGSAVSAASAHASTSYYVDVRAPNAAASFIGEITFITPGDFSVSGQLKDIKCNSHDVVLNIWVNVRYAFVNPWLWNSWPGKRQIRHIRHSEGCGTSRTVSFDFADEVADDYDVDFIVCDDGPSDSCSSTNWPNDWYGVYRNPYAK